MTDTHSPAWYAAAPELWQQFRAIEAAAAGAVDATVLAPVRAAVDEMIGRHAAGTTATSSVDPRAAACIAFAEQFVVDVATMTDELRQPLFAAMGADTLAFVQALYVIDIFGRARVGLQRLYGGDVDDVMPPMPSEDPATLWPRIEQLMQDVARRTQLDPLTTELVRMRGARFHNCRLCQSRRSVKAIDAAGDLDRFEALDGGSSAAELSDRQRAALDLTDALVTQPRAIDDDLRARVLDQLATGEIVEIVLDVVRNAANKIAVAFGADAPLVAEGIEFYDIDPGGDVVADVDLAVVRAATSG